MKKTMLLIFVLGVIGVHTFCDAAITITSFPWQADFSNTNWEASYKWTSQNAYATTHTNGGWNNRPYVQFVIGNTDGTYSALGSFVFSGTASRVNVRYLLWVSRDLLLVHPDPSYQPKIVDWQNSSGRRIYLHHWWARGCGWSFTAMDMIDAKWAHSCESPPSDRQCNLPSCTFKLEDWLDEWISVEHEYNVITQTYTIYVTTQDGTYNETAVVRNDTTSTPIGIIQYLGHYGYNSSRTSSTFFRISELIMNNRYIGPPSGFVRTNPNQPNPPTGLRIMP